MKRSVKEIFSRDEILIGDLFALVLSKIRVILYTLIICFLLGIIIAVTTPVEFDATTVILSEFNQSDRTGLGQLSGLAGLAGINIPQGVGAQNTINPEMYPDIIESKPFLLGLIDKEFYFEKKKKALSLREYFLEERPDHFFKKTLKFIFSIPHHVLKFFSGSTSNALVPENENAHLSTDTIKRVSHDEVYVINHLRKRINLEIDQRMITLTVTMSEPLIAAELNSIVQDKLIYYITNYQIEKQRKNLEFVEERVTEAEEEFRSSQNRLASFRDSNQGIISQRARTKEEQLQAEFNISFNIYNTLKQEYEQARIQLKRDTPVFTSFDPVTVPLGPSQPQTFKILILSIIGGLIFGFVLIVILISHEYFR